MSSFFLAFKASPVEKEENAHIHGAGQIGLLAALALFGVDYFTSYFYATGEMMHALHPYGLQEWGYIAAAIISFANIVFGALYMYSLGIFNEGGGSYTASMRYLTPGLSLVVAVVLIQDYIFTIVVSALSGGDQLLSVLGQYGTNWIWHFLIGAVLAAITWYLTIRGRGESARVVFTLLGVFVLMTLLMVAGLIYAHLHGIPAVAVDEPVEQVTLGQALLHLLTASMKGLVALTGLEAMSNGIQFVINEDAGIVKWGKKTYAEIQKIVGVLQRQSRDRPPRPDFLPVLRWLDHLYPDLLCHPLQCIRWHAGPHSRGQSGLYWFYTDPWRRDHVLGLSNSGCSLALSRIHDCLSGSAGHRMARCGHWRDS